MPLTKSVPASGSLAPDRPAPMTPSDCDLRGYDYMPLFGHRLFSSSLYTESTDEEFRAALRLWWSAWQQCPAGSLPSSDNGLATLADYGRDQKGWKRVKARALHGFVLCSDDRLYHPMLCEEAVKAYAMRLKHDAKRDADRKRLQEWRDRQKKPDHGGVGNGNETRADTAQETKPETRIETEDETRFVGGRQHNTTQQAKQQLLFGLKLPAEPFPEFKLVKIEPDTGRPTVNGWYLDRTQERVFEAARIDDARWTGNVQPLIAWLAAGIEPDTIVGAIKRCAERTGYTVRPTLNYFDKPVREAHGKVPA